MHVINEHYNSHECWMSRFFLHYIIYIELGLNCYSALSYIWLLHEGQGNNTHNTCECQI